MHSSVTLSRRLFALVLLCLSSTLFGQDKAEQERFFENKIRPLLVAKCLDCHGKEDPDGKLQLDSRVGWQRGGKSGPAIVPGDPAASLLIRAVSYKDAKLKMPPPREGERLTAAEVQALSTWIRSGAIDPRTGTSKQRPIDQLAKSHWAFQPLKKTPPPPDAHPIDYLIDRQLNAKGFKTSPPASLHVLLRRATYDLHGLPPTADQLTTTHDQYERLLDALLASPRYGERWGRHWLDVARYSDAKDGVLMYGDARIRPFGYTYRDYVIRAFNSDKPFNQFIREQLAADLLDLPDDSPELAAMGFLTLGRMFDSNPHDIIDDRIDVVARGLLGLTVSCARCHDHKFDPIPTADYYSLYGVFASSHEPLVRPVIGSIGKAQAHEDELNGKLKALLTLREQHYEATLKTARDRTADYLLQVATTEPDISETKIFFLSLLPSQLRPQFTYRWRKLIARRGFDGDPVFGPWHDLMKSPKLQVAKWKRQKIEPRLIEALSKAKPATPKAIAEIYGKVINEIWQQESKLQQEIAHARALMRSLDEGIDLADIVAGGNGLGMGKPGTGIHPVTGTATKGETGFIEVAKPDAYVKVDNPFIDGVFVPKSKEVTVSSTGLRVSGLAASTGKTWDYFKAGPSSGFTSNVINGVDYTAKPNTMLGLHANKGITFDLTAIRQAHSLKNVQFRGLFGHGGAKTQSVLNFGVYVDGKEVLVENAFPAQGKGKEIDIELPQGARFLTLIVTEGGQGISHDQAILGNPRIVSSNVSQGKPDPHAKEKARLRKLIATKQEQIKQLRTDPVMQLLVGKESPYFIEKHQIDLYLSRKLKDDFRGKVRELDAISVKHKMAAPRALVLVDSTKPVQPVIFQRGDPSMRGSPVPRQFLKIATSGARAAFASKGSGRLELANAIANPSNPLTARVWVNRVWMHHFGEPLVANPSDFGLRTKKPIHHELLDYLATQLIKNGWQTKPLHRLIMTSKAYQRSSVYADDSKLVKQAELDPDNQWIWRAFRRRLDLEQMRDTMLSLSAQLDLKMFGRPQPITDPKNVRRTVYAFVERQSIPDVVRTFDFANADTSVGKRPSTIVPQQSLFLMNSKFITEAATGVVERLKHLDDSARIDELYRMALARNPTKEEKQLGLTFVKMNAWTQYVQVILMSNELMYID